MANFSDLPDKLVLKILDDLSFSYPAQRVALDLVSREISRLIWDPTYWRPFLLARDGYIEKSMQPDQLRTLIYNLFQGVTCLTQEKLFERAKTNENFALMLCRVPRLFKYLCETYIDSDRFNFERAKDYPLQFLLDLIRLHPKLMLPILKLHATVFEEKFWHIQFFFPLFANQKELRNLQLYLLKQTSFWFESVEYYNADYGSSEWMYPILVTRLRLPKTILNSLKFEETSEAVEQNRHVLIDAVQKELDTLNQISAVTRLNRAR